MTAPLLSIVAPAFDEEACIEASVRSWLRMFDDHDLKGEVVVTDDGSTDRTGEILRGLEDGEPRVRVVSFARNGGYGRALRAAIAEAEGDFVVTIDADGQFDPEDVPRLLGRQRQGDLDLVTGYRRRKSDSPLRVAADRGLHLTVRALFGLRLRDTNCALKLVRRSWIQAAPLEARGYPAPTEIVVRAHRDGLRMAEIGVAHRERAGGATKLRLLRTAVGSMAFLLRLRATL